MFNEENGHEKIPTLLTYGMLILIPLFQIILIVLQLTNVINWPWYFVCLPLEIVVGGFCGIMLLIFIISGIFSFFKK